jgi:N-acetylmuramoyl-L-alanine amidase
MRYSIHAGHNPDGLVASGAAGYMKESVESRKIVNYIMSHVDEKEAVICDVTVNDGKSQNDILQRLCQRMNNVMSEINISIHLNGGGGTGVECWTYGVNDEADRLAKKICENISELGFRNRGVKQSKSLYILRHSVQPTIIIEVCFVDTERDYETYMRIGYEKVAEAIMEALGIAYANNDTAESDEVDEPASNADNLYYVQVGALRNKLNAEILAENLRKKGFSAYIKR